MAVFGSGYDMPMDRSYEVHDHNHHREVSAVPAKSTGDVGIRMGDLGMSMGLGPVPNVQAIQSKIRPGSKTVEFVFFGSGKGQAQGQTPGMYGKKQRQALVEMGKANKVDFTTHSTIGIYGLAGMDQQGNFSKASKNSSLQELKRAVEFAADVGHGGPIVVHTGEFLRPIADAEWNKDSKDPYANRFKMYEKEEERTAYRVVDKRTGSVVEEARKNMNVSRPEWLMAKPGEEYKENGVTKRAKENERIYIDYFGNKVDPENKVPEWDKEKQEFKVRQVTWDELEKEADYMTKRAREAFKKWKSGEMTDTEFEKTYWGRFKDAPDEEFIQVKPEEAYVIEALETGAATSRGWAIQHAAGFQETMDRVKKLKKAYEIVKKIEDTPEGRKKMQRLIQEEGLDDVLKPEMRLRSELIDQEIKKHEARMLQSQESSASQMAQAEQAKERIRHIESAERYALDEAYDAYARSAITAMQQTDKLRKQKDLKRPLAVALENLFPEHYGSHPDELIRLVEGSRKKMIQLLTDPKQGYVSEGTKVDLRKANELAEDHITATFDTGHLNMWRKYWKPKQGQTMEQAQKEFDDWSLKKVAEMAEKKIIGHVHIDDNYGYHDDHLAPGEGNTPIREMIKILKEKGYNKELIVEPGADYTTDASGFHSVMKTWRHFDLPAYGGTGVGAGRSWNQVGYGWFGQNQPPYFTFGGYSPSEDWTLWSGVPFE